MAEASVRYIVEDVDAATHFYEEVLGFELEARMGPGFAIVRGAGLRLLLSGTGGSGGAAQPVDGSSPESGGWNRIQIRVEDLETEVSRLREAGVTFRGDVVLGRGGKQILLEDPSGNPVELFEPHA